MLCTDAAPLIARYADDEPSLPAAARDDLAAHLAGCAACRAALEGQRDVAAILRERPIEAPRPGLVARVSARIDAGEASDGWIGLANWRRWSAALVPLAAALLVAAYLDLAGATPASPSSPVAPTFDEWTTGDDAPAVLQPSVTGETLIEAVLIGAAPSSGDTNVR